MIRTFFLLCILLFPFSVKSDEKNKIIEKFKTIDNLSFDFNQTIKGKSDHGSCVIKYPKKYTVLIKEKIIKLWYLMENLW